MNIDIIEKAVVIRDRIIVNKAALDSIDIFLSRYPGGNSDGESTSADYKIYTFYLTENRDGSGLRVDLTGSLIQIEVLLSTKKLLEDQIDKDLKLIESL